MPDLQEIYSEHSDQYERLVAREDYQGNIFPALNRIRPLQGLDVVDLGTGTGRLACMLAPVARSVQAFDTSKHMLDAAVAKLQQSGLTNWHVGVADHRELPLEDGVADVAISGWSMCYAAIWCEGMWQEELGTGHEAPHRYDELKEYLAYLDEHGFSSTWIRTDYQFESLAEAEQLTRFFFGEELAQTVVENNWVNLPECTGIWWSDVEDQ